MKIRYISLFFVLLMSVVPLFLLAGCSSEGQTATSPAATTTSPVAAENATSAAPSAPQTATSPQTTVPPRTTTVPPAQAVVLNVSAAASLTDAIKEVNSQYTANNKNVTITANFASSGTLQKQIEQGAPADVFISAAAKQMDALEKAGLIVSGTRQNLLINKVVLIVPNNSTLGLTDIRDLATDKVNKIAIGDPKFVPAGDYAQQAFDLLGITEKVTSKYIIGADVKAVLAYVESGNVDVGMVYSTDAQISTKVKVVAFAPDEINAKVVYPVAVVAASKVQDASAAYKKYLFGVEARAIFEKYGFTMVGK